MENVSFLILISLIPKNIMENKQKFKPDPKLKLMDQVRQDLIGKTEIGIFLSSLAIRDKVSPSTQRQALDHL